MQLITLSLQPINKESYLIWLPDTLARITVTIIGDDPHTPLPATSLKLSYRQLLKGVSVLQGRFMSRLSVFVGMCFSDWLTDVNILRQLRRQRLYERCGTDPPAAGVYICPPPRLEQAVSFSPFSIAKDPEGNAETVTMTTAFHRPK